MAATVRVSRETFLIDKLLYFDLYKELYITGNNLLKLVSRETYTKNILMFFENPLEKLLKM